MQKSFALLTLGVVAFASTTPRAQEGNKPAAEAMFDEGLRLFDAGQFPEACAKFAASERIDPATGTLMNLARCDEKIGKTASAWAAYREVQALARKEGNAHREAFARTHELELQPQLARLTIVVAASAGVVVRLDDVTLDSGEWQTPLPIDPGVHHLETSAPGKKSRTDSIKVAMSENASFTIPALENAPAPPRSVAPSDNDHADVSSGKMPAVRVVALIAGGVGLVGVGVGSVFGLTAISKANDAQPHCHPFSGCDSTGASLRSDSGTFADISTVAFVVGGAALATGIVLWLTSSPSRSSTSRASLQLVPSIDLAHEGGGFLLRGSL